MHLVNWNLSSNGHEGCFKLGSFYSFIFFCWNTSAILFFNYSTFLSLIIFICFTAALFNNLILKLHIMHSAQWQTFLVRQPPATKIIKTPIKPLMSLEHREIMMYNIYIYILYIFIYLYVCRILLLMLCCRHIFDIFHLTVRRLQRKSEGTFWF